MNINKNIHIAATLLYLGYVSSCFAILFSAGILAAVLEQNDPNRIKGNNIESQSMFLFMPLPFPRQQ